MGKINIIDHCGDCGERYYLGSVLMCRPEERVTTEGDMIPEWCPLEDHKKPHPDCFYHGGRGCNNTNLDAKVIEIEPGGSYDEQPGCGFCDPSG